MDHLSFILSVSVRSGVGGLWSTGQCTFDSTFFLAYHVWLDRSINRGQHVDKRVSADTGTYLICVVRQPSLLALASLGLFGFVLGWLALLWRVPVDRGLSEC